MSVSIWFPGRWPDLNSYIDAERANRFQAAKVKQIYTDAARVIAQASGVEMVETPCAVQFTWRLTDRRTDPDNIAFAAKFILDGMVAAGVLPNDGHRQINSLEHAYVIDREAAPGVTVTLLSPFWS